MKESPVFSILIPSWNNLKYLKACVESIHRHSHYKHEIILHINQGTDGTLEWAKEQGILFSYSPENIGVCKALNQSAGLATTPYICYFNDDMIALPDWDFYLMNEITSIGHDLFFLSATMIEPFEKKNACVISGRNYGLSPEEFKEEALLNDFRSFEFHDWYGASWPPNVVSKKLWDAVGGYSEEFSPGLYSDPDFSMKLWQKGVRIFKGVSASRVYHFGSKSLHRIVMNNGRKQFINKWGITPGFFYRQFLKMGKIYKGELGNPNPLLYLFNKMRCMLVHCMQCTNRK